MLKEYAKKVLGVVLILLGIAGLVLPFLQGFAMIFAGLALLDNKRATAYLHKLKSWWNKKQSQWRSKK